MEETKMTTKIVIGQYADYLNTGMWSMKDGAIFAPDDLTIEQLRDFLLVSGGYVYLRGPEGKLAWGGEDDGI